MIYFVLPVVALLTATLSAIIGMGGGMLLLAAMFAFMPHGEAVPCHAAVQLVSNSTRTLAFLEHVDWRVVGRFAVGAIPGGVLGVTLLYWLGEPGESEPWLKMLVGVYILGSLLIPQPRREAHKPVWWDFPLLGVAAGASAFTVGAVGPLIAPLFARRGFLKERLVATKAICQTLLHAGKIPAFLLLRSYENIEQLGLVTLMMAIVVIPGTILGKRLLRHVSDRRFVTLYRVALLVAGVKIIAFDGIAALIRQA